MSSLLRPSLLLSASIALGTGAPPLAAQRVEVTTRRAPSADEGTANTTERQLRALERRADSLSRLYGQGEELSATERRRLGAALDRTVQQIDVLSMQLAEMNGHGMDGGQMRVRIAPMAGDEARAFMRRALTESNGVQPRGWLGIVVSGAAREPRVENGELIIRYLTHPAIISVEPSSPAERAGLIPSDTLIAYDGKDVRNTDIAITRLLRPNKRVLVRIRRDGRTRDIPVTIADVPSRIALRREMNVEIAPPRTLGALREPVEFPRAPTVPVAPWPSTMSAPRSWPSRPSTAPTPPAAPMPAIVYGVGFNGVAGAQLVAVTRGLGQTLGVRQGVLVTNAPVGSPAYQSGLRDGDVIARAAGHGMRTVGDLREAVQNAAENGEHSVALEVVRNRRTRKATLRW